jgi:hypothetical protein
MLALTILLELYLLVVYLIRRWASMSTSQHEASGVMVFCYILLCIPICYKGKSPLTTKSVSPIVIALMGLLMSQQLFCH